IRTCFHFLVAATWLGATACDREEGLKDEVLADCQDIEAPDLDGEADALAFIAQWEGTPCLEPLGLAAPTEGMALEAPELFLDVALVLPMEMLAESLAALLPGRAIAPIQNRRYPTTDGL